MPSRCATCKGNSNCVPGDGPKPARVMCVGEAPGRDEDRVGRVFVGVTGLEFNQTYLPLAGLSRDEVYVTNTRKCRPDLNRKPTDREARDCASTFLPGELGEVRPEVVVLMGGTACGLIPDIDLEVEHGIPRWCGAGDGLFGWAGWVVPMFHPALGLHDTSKMTYILEDWERLNRWLAFGDWPVGGWIGGEDARDYRLLESTRDLDDYLSEHIAFSAPAYPLVGVDTETHDGRPWSVQFSLGAGTARMVLVENAPMRERVGKWLRGAVHGTPAIRGKQAVPTRGGTELVFHNVMADVQIVREVLDIREFRWRDTMAEAWHLGNLPQGLKALSYRLLGRRRPGWEEVVGPASREVVGDWLMRALEVVEGMSVAEVRTSAKTGKMLKPKQVPHALVRPVKSVLMNAVKGDGYDVWAKVRERVGWSGVEMLEEMLGPIPAKGIAHVRLEEAVRYGCSDADDTLALAHELDRLRKGMVEVAEGDVDAS